MTQLINNEARMFVMSLFLSLKTFYSLYRIYIYKEIQFSFVLFGFQFIKAMPAEESTNKYFLIPFKLCGGQLLSF